ncbi:tetratricopeptide repeat protein [Paludisphaera mucosa]|uniref:Tetratricopeptide repeat protein n=1 Tax=Paludisphaera mucosa TaxID=3030827 RepID=A0ABT6FKV3_9BACT|nr:tetratricopeptide repeat protein [Paludisphaera mucosa]MDG3008008.1 tetratricopeptide repeat protein [Paludisphaera mucosa]
MDDVPHPTVRRRDRPPTPGARRLGLAVALLTGGIAAASPGTWAGPDDSSRQRQSVGATGMWGPHSGPLLTEYYEAFLRDRDLARFREQVAARYSEETLCRVLGASPQVAARRGAVLALGVMGTFDGCNTLLGRALRDDDPVVRTMAERALWVVWFRADAPENNQALEEVRTLAAAERLDEAVDRASRLVARAPRFAEAYNQRAIAYFKLGRFAESAEDCIRTLTLNPYHIGALGGLAQCQLELDQPREALKTLRRGLKLQPHSEALTENVRRLEARLESDGPR